VKEAQAEMDELAPELKDTGLQYVFKHNCVTKDCPKQQIKSVNLVEPKGDGEEVVQFTWTTKTLKMDSEVVTAYFKSRLPGLNVNDYAEWVINADFDKDVFVVGGKFDQRRFDRFRAAIQAVAEELGVTNPLSFSKEFKATAEACDIRFQQLNAVQNLALHDVMPTSLMLKPQRAKED
jgi:hypothetical protein